MSWLPFVEVHVTWDEFAKLADAATGDLSGAVLLEACRTMMMPEEVAELQQYHADGVDLRLVARTTVRQRFSFKEEWK